MADKEISALLTSTSLNPTDYFHVKQGSADVKMTIGTILTAHNALSNPHNTTKTDVGLGLVLNAEQLSRSLNLSDILNTTTARTNLDVYSKAETSSLVNTHVNSTANPHAVTKAQVGLGNVNNWSASSAVNNDSATTYATALAVKTVQDNLNQYTSLPKGAVILWTPNAGAIPSGFAICNGQTVGGIVTPNLLGFFLRFGNEATAGNTGGSDTVTHTHSGAASGTSITKEQLPEFNLGIGYTQGVSRGSPDGQPAINAGPPFTTKSETIGQGLPHTHPLSIGETTVNNMPSYYTLIPIMKYI